MKNTLKNFYSSLPIYAKIYVLILAFVFPVAWVGIHAGWFDLYSWFDLAPALFWKGQVWRVLTYAFLPAGPLDWMVTLFWNATLVSLIARNWPSGWRFWNYILSGALGGALPMVLLKASMQTGWVGGSAILFALLVAWNRLYRNERLILLGFGEVSVRQAAIFIGIINSVILFFCAGWFVMAAMWCGGVAGWIFLAAGSQRVLSRESRVAESERMARLEL